MVNLNFLNRALGIKPKSPTAKELFDSMFNDGDEVVIITALDEYDHGKMSIADDGIVLRHINRPDKFYHWVEVRFMAHDGFPVKKLMGADGSESIEKSSFSESNQDIIKKVLLSDDQSEIKELLDKLKNTNIKMEESQLELKKFLASIPSHSSAVKSANERMRSNELERRANETPSAHYETGHRTSRRYSGRMGDPYEFENVYMQLIHTGNCGPQWWLHPYQEVVVLSSSDQARGLLWNLPTLYELECVAA